MLAVPGSSERFIEKSRGLPVDALFLDLEDAVAKAAVADETFDEPVQKGTDSWGRGQVRLPPIHRLRLDQAGATIQGDYLVRGAPAGPDVMMCEGYERAMGFLPGVAIDQHFSARNRFKDMTALVKQYPQFLGIGLDEGTALVVQLSLIHI